MYFSLKNSKIYILPSQLVIYSNIIWVDVYGERMSSMAKLASADFWSIVFIARPCSMEFLEHQLVDHYIFTDGTLESYKINCC